ncbi:hypothetical protein [Devosia sp. Root685]|uniref:hypothetical protein n=1 Tax=Devosia sp. Root685 TaxID=1736587 RepID=UPI000AB042F7|nr:hypothetical protein [Devosia sp. Root685]
MSKLVIFTSLDRPLLNGGSEAFPCGPNTAPDFEARLGAQVIVASILPAEQGYVALGTLNGLRTDDAGNTLVDIADLRLFPEPVMFVENAPSRDGIHDLSEPLFDQIIARALGHAEIDDAPASDDFVVAIYQFTSQLARQQQKRCSFSDVTTEIGVACVIRPLHKGGALHVSNFLFLDPEPGVLFEHFAWTVGPQFEIIVDMHAVRPDIADTVNRTGMLALRDAIAAWPDREALAWHREQFFARFEAKGQP